jgi:hypothetical protein
MSKFRLRCGGKNANPLLNKRMKALASDGSRIYVKRE